MSIMYVCDSCRDGNPEACGRFDREELRVLPTGEWLCDGCFDDWEFDLKDDEFSPSWSAFPAPPEYVEKPEPEGRGEP